MTKRNHVVPRKYLWWFRLPDRSESSAGMVWMYDRVVRKWTKVPVHNAGVIKNFYQEEDEVGLADQVEGPALRSIEKLHGGHQIDFRDRLKVAWYAYAMLARVPSARELAKRILVEDADLMVKRTVEAAREAYRVTEIPITEHIEEMFREMVDNIEADPSALPDGLYDDMVQRVWYSSKTGAVPGIAKILAHFAWRVIFSGKKQKFITSDNPVHVFALEMGPDDPNFELVMPLGSECSLHICRQGYPDMLEFVQADERLVRRLNLRVLSRADRFIFSSRQEQWVDKALSRPTSQLQTPYLDWGDDQFISGFYRGETCDRCGRVFTKEELDAAEITHRGETDGDEVRVNRVMTIRHSCPS